MSVRAFVPGGKKVAARQALLMSLPNGDWRDRKHVPIHVRPGEAIDHHLHAKSVARVLVDTLLHKRFTYKQERNWKGGEEEHGDLGLLDVMDGLLTPTFVRFCWKQRSTPRRRG